MSKSMASVIAWLIVAALLLVVVYLYFLRDKPIDPRPPQPPSKALRKDWLPTNEELLVKPEVGKSVFDPTFSVKIERVTDALNTPEYFGDRNGDFGIVVSYANWSPVNSDGTLILLYGRGGFWFIYDAVTGEFIKRLQSLKATERIVTDVQPRWSAHNPDIIRFLDGNEIKWLSVEKDKVIEMNGFSKYALITFGDEQRGWSANDSLFAFVGRIKDDEPFSWYRNKAELVVYKSKSRKTFAIDIPFSRDQHPDWVSISPSGKYVVASYVGQKAIGRGQHHGVDVYDISSDEIIYLEDIETPRKSEHSILMTWNGKDVLITDNATAGYSSPFMPDTARIVLEKIYGKDSPRHIEMFVLEPNTRKIDLWAGAWDQTPLFGCIGGYIVISTYAKQNVFANWPFYPQGTQEIFLIDPAKPYEIRRIVHTRAAVFSPWSFIKFYWGQPNATGFVDAKGSAKIVFTSGWSQKQEMLDNPGFDHRDIVQDVYWIEIPKGEL